MEKCNVCGKTTLLPEIIGKASVCKVCFMKTNGPLWRYRPYEKYEEAETQRNRTLENAKKQGYPEIVIEGINEFFDRQISGMKCCDVCGQSVQTLNELGKAKLCKKCFSRINSDVLKKTEYLDNDEVEKDRGDILKKVKKYHFPDFVKNEINNYFDSKLHKGQVFAIDGGKGQILRVYDSYCILITKTYFNEEEMSVKYAKLLRKNKLGGIVSNSAAQSLVRGFLTGGVVKAGMSLATNVAIGAAADAIAPVKENFFAMPGELYINYEEYDTVDFQKALEIGGDEQLGYLKFRNRTNASADLIFFFWSDYKVKEVYQYICEQINNVHNVINKRQSEIYLKTNESVADEILKFKQLLDMGAITEEEFVLKKKELLGI